MSSAEPPRIVLPHDGPVSSIQVGETVLHLPGGAVHHVRDRTEIPAELVHLDVDEHGVAVPYVGRDGPEQEKVAARIRRAMIDGLCGVCGFDLEWWKCWHVRADTADQARACRYMTGAPMHVEACSRYAAACYPGPGRWWRYVARGYRARRTTDGQLVAHAQAPSRVDDLGLLG